MQPEKLEKKPEPWSAAAIACKAAELVGGDRQNSHGDKEKNFANIATLWNAYLSIRPDPTAPISALDHAHMMVLLKIARTQLGARNLDDHVDMAGYAACAGELVQQQIDRSWVEAVRQK